MFQQLPALVLLLFLIVLTACEADITTANQEEEQKDSIEIVETPSYLDTFYLENSPYYVVIDQMDFPNYYEYQIFEKSRNKVDSLGPAVGHTCLGLDSIYQKDFNFDGIKDLALASTSCNSYPNEYQDIYILLNGKLQLAFTNLRQPFVVASEQRLYSRGWHKGDVWYKIYHWTTDSFHLDERHSFMWEDEGYFHTYTKYKQGNIIEKQVKKIEGESEVSKQLNAKLQAARYK